MNIVKSMEAIVIGAVAMTFITAVATAAAPAPAPKKAAVAVATADNVTTIVVAAKRLTPAQKAALAD